MVLRKNKSIITNILFKTKKPLKDSYVWNAVAGILNASQSVIMLIVITRTNGLYDAGVFSIAYAIANLTLTLGQYGMRSYQVTDVNENYSINDYFTSRIITCFAMVIAGIGYPLYGILILDYSIDKFIVVILVCLWKAIDALEDVFHGWFQQQNRLDVASKALCIRLAIGILVYIVLILLFKDLIIATLACTCVSYVVFFLLNHFAVHEFGKVNIHFDFLRLKKLLLVCFPLCAGAFFSIYIANAPKYVIDANMTDEMQAYFNFIFMPVFVITMLSGFIYAPIITQLAKALNNKDNKKFNKIIYSQCISIVLIVFIAIIVAYFIGIPVLSWLYATDLDNYKFELCILMLGGGFSAFSGFFSIVVTSMHAQHLLLIGYLVVATLAKLLSSFFVTKYEILGAVVLYDILMGLLAFFFCIIMIVKIKGYRKKSDKIQKGDIL